MPREYKDYLSTLTAATPDNAADYVQFYDTSAATIKKVLIGDLTPTGVSTPLNWEGDWITATSYQVGDGVSQDGSSYACLITHTSGTFATDLAASRWQLIAEKGEPGTGGNYETSSNLITSAAIATHFATSDLPVFMDTNVTVTANPQTFPSNARFVHGGGMFVKSGSGKIAFAGIGLDNPMSPSPLFSGFGVGDITFAGTSYPYRINAGLWDNTNWGDKAQCAIDAFSGLFVIIDVPSGGTLATQLTIKTKKVVMLGPGEFLNACPSAPNIVQEDYTVFCGSGQGITTLYTSTDVTSDPLGTGCHGYYEFAANPANNDTILFNGVTFTFKTSPAGGTDVQIGSGATGGDTNLGITIYNLVTALNASANASINVATYSSTDGNGTPTGVDKNGSRVRTVHDTLGNVGRTFTLGTVHANISRSDPTLVGSEKPLIYSAHVSDGIANTSIRCHGMTIKGPATGLTTYTAWATILYGVGRDLHVYDITYDHTHNFHAYIGVFGATGLVPENCSIRRLHINGTMTQSVGCLIGRNFVIEDITWDDVSWHPMSAGTVLIDLEPNTPDGILEGIRMNNLIMDGRTAQQTWGGIAVQGVDIADPRDMQISNVQIKGGETFDYIFKDADVDLTNNKVKLPGHSFMTSTKIWLGNSGGAVPGGLTTGRFYWIIIDTVDPNNYVKFAENYWMAKAGNAVDLTSASGGGTYTVTLFGLMDTGINIDSASNVQLTNIIVNRARAIGLRARNCLNLSTDNIKLVGCAGNSNKAVTLIGVADSELRGISAKKSRGDLFATDDMEALAESEATFTVNTTGTAVYIPVGVAARRWWEGRTVTITGVDYVVDQYVDSYHIILASSAGTQTGATMVTKFSSNEHRDSKIANYTLAGTSVILNTTNDRKVTETASASYPVPASAGMVVMNSTAARTATLPDPTTLNGKEIQIIDGAGNAGTNNITLAGATIAGPSVIDSDYGSLTVKAYPSGYRVIAQIAVAAVAGTPGVPETITGLKRWYAADAITGLVDGDPVATWTDGSGNQNASQGTSGSRPVYKTSILNSLPIVRFDGSDDFLSVGDLSALTEGEVFIVLKLDADPPSALTSAGLWYLGNSSSNTYYPFPSGDIYEEFGTTVRKDNITYAGHSLTSWHIYNIWSAPSDWASNYNTSSLYTTATNTVSFPSACKLGESSASGYVFDGDIAEFILYDNKLSSGDRTAIITYLQAKYAI